MLDTVTRQAGEAASERGERMWGGLLWEGKQHQDRDRDRCLGNIPAWIFFSRSRGEKM